MSVAAAPLAIKLTGGLIALKVVVIIVIVAIIVAVIVVRRRRAGQKERD